MFVEDIENDESLCNNTKIHHSEKKIVPKQANILNPEQFKRLLIIVSASKYAKRDRLLILLSYGLGLRAIELAALKIHQVVDEGGRVREALNLTVTKGGEPRTLYLSDPKIKKSIIEYIEERKYIAEKKRHVFSHHQPLLLSQKNGAFTNKTIARRFDIIYKAAGFIGVTSHSGRRTFATNLIEQGIDIKAVSTLMGHSNIQMTSQYVQNNPIRLSHICSKALY
jgi:integrase/recombinase XerD